MLGAASFNPEGGGDLGRRDGVSFGREAALQCDVGGFAAPTAAHRALLPH
jgi:hypothetical protein